MKLFIAYKFEKKKKRFLANIELPYCEWTQAPFVVCYFAYSVT